MSRHWSSPGKTTLYLSAVALLLPGCSDITDPNACFDEQVLITADGKAVDMGGSVTFETTLNTPDCVPGIEGE